MVGGWLGGWGGGVKIEVAMYCLVLALCSDNEPQKVALEHGDPDREHVDSESAGTQNGVVTAVEESSAVEMAAKGATAVRILEEDAV